MKNCPSNCKKTKWALKLLSQLHLYVAAILNLTWFSRKFYYFSSDLSFAWLPLHTLSKTNFPLRSEQRMNNKQLTEARQEEWVRNWVETRSKQSRGGNIEPERTNLTNEEGIFSFLSHTVTDSCSWKHPWTSQRISLQVDPSNCGYKELTFYGILGIKILLLWPS